MGGFTHHLYWWDESYSWGAQLKGYALLSCNLSIKSTRCLGIRAPPKFSWRWGFSSFLFSLFSSREHLLLEMFPIAHAPPSSKVIFSTSRFWSIDVSELVMSFFMRYWNKSWIFLQISLSSSVYFLNLSLTSLNLISSLGYKSMGSFGCINRDLIIFFLIFWISSCLSVRYGCFW